MIHGRIGNPSYVSAVTYPGGTQANDGAFHVVGSSRPSGNTSVEAKNPDDEA
jgi:hypothetical protein